MELATDRLPEPWSGRDDGPGAEHRRLFHAVQLAGATSSGVPDVVVIGFASDEGVKRNQGRTGAAAGPGALRSALGGLSLAPGRTGGNRADLSLLDVGDVVVDTDLEGGQERLAQAVSVARDAGALPLVLGGGHEVAYGSYLGLARSRTRGACQRHAGRAGRIGILNLDAHFDLRIAPQATSGTPFRQAFSAEEAAGHSLVYSVVGISEASNTQALFDAADSYKVSYLLDEEVTYSNLPAVEKFVDIFLASVDMVYLTLDLDVLPAAVAPGVSAPAALGVDPLIINLILRRVAASGKLAVFDVAELNPSLDIDGRTAKTAARLIHTVLTHFVPLTDKEAS